MQTRRATGRDTTPPAPNQPPPVPNPTPAPPADPPAPNNNPPAPGNATTAAGNVLQDAPPNNTNPPANGGNTPDTNDIDQSPATNIDQPMVTNNNQSPAERFDETLPQQVQDLREEIRLMNAQLLRKAPTVSSPPKEKIEIPTLDISDIDSEHKWFDYKFKLEATCARLSIGLGEADVDPEGDQHLYYLFTSGLSGRPLNILRTVPKGKGRAAYHKLCKEYEAANPAAINQLHTRIEQLRIEGSDDPIDALSKLDTLLFQLTARGEPVGDRERTRHMLRMMSGNAIYDITRELLTNADTSASLVQHHIIERFRAYSMSSGGPLAGATDTKRPGESRSRSTAPGGWQFKHGDCRTCGSRFCPGGTGGTCNVPPAKRRWNLWRRGYRSPHRSGRDAKRHRPDKKPGPAERFDTGRRAGDAKDAAGHAVSVGAYFVPANGTDFIVDTGSSVHFAAMSDVIDGTFRSIAVPFDGVTDTKGTTAGLGDVMITTRDTRGNNIELILHDVYITEKGIRLLSVARLIEDLHDDELRFDFDFRRRRVHIKQAGMLREIPLHFNGNHYTIANSHPACYLATPNAELRHRRAGHYGHHPDCIPCLRGKATKRAATGSFDNERNNYGPGESWQVDIKHMNAGSRQGNKYVLRFVDIVSGYFHSEPIASMDSITIIEAFRNFLHRCELGDVNVKRIHGDNQFEIKLLRELLKERKIVLTLSASETSEHSAIVERSLRTTHQSVRAMLLDQSLPISFWEFAWMHSEWCWNRLPGKTGVAPITALFRTTDFENPHSVPVFGSRAFALSHTGKGAVDMTRTGRFVGRHDHRYLVLPDDGRSVLKLRHVRFVEGHAAGSNSHGATAPGRSPPPLTSEEKQEPRNWREVACSRVRRGEWMPALKDELRGLEKRGTFTVVPRENRRTITTRLVLKTKKDAEGNTISRKARLVAHGFKQRAGIDYDEISSTVSRFESVRVILAACACLSFTFTQVDVDQAYLQSKMDKELYVEIPDGYNDIMDTDFNRKTHVMKLNKSLPGLKQSGRMWALECQSTFRALGLTQCRTDTCVFVDHETILTIYVDDMLIASPRHDRDKEIVDALQAKYGVKDMGPLQTLLGIRIVSKDGIQLDQPGYVAKILNEHQTSDTRSQQTPWPTIVDREDSPALDDDDHATYRSIVGELMWLTNSTRPDLSHSVSSLSQHLSAPRKIDLKNAHRVLRYVATYPGKAIAYRPLASGKMKITCYVDSDFANDISRRSRTGYVIFLNSGIVSWKSKLQPVVSLSTTEAEFIAIAFACMEVKFIMMLLAEINLEVTDIVVRSDSEPALKLIRNPVGHARTKHIDIRYRFIRELAEGGKVKFEYVNSHDNVADMLTKQLAGNDHHRHLGRLYHLDDY